MALWKARSLSPEQKVQLVEEESEAKHFQSEESGSCLGFEDVKTFEIYADGLPMAVSFFFFFNSDIANWTKFVFSIKKQKYF